MRNQGHKAGASGISKQVVFLDFGALRVSDTGFGQQLFGYNAPVISLSRALAAAEQFSIGYHNGWQTPKTGSITIAWGTSNGRIPTGWSSSTITSAGTAFAGTVTDLRSYVRNQAYNRQYVSSAMDIEEDVQHGWNDYPPTHTFVDAFRGVTNAPFLINFGSDEIGTFRTPQPGFGSWTADAVVHLSRSSRTAACPQIYNTTRGQEWAQTEVIADDLGTPIYFFCTMAQTSPTATNLSAADAWNVLHTDLATINPSFNYVAPAHNYLGSRTTVIGCRGATYCSTP